MSVLPVVLLPKCCCYLLLDSVHLLLPFILFSRRGGFTALYRALNELSTSVLTLDWNHLTHFIPRPVGCPVNWRFSPRVSPYTICLFCSSSWENTVETWSLNSPLHAFLFREKMCYTLRIKNVASSIHFSGCGMFSLLDKADQLSFVLCWVLALKYQHCHFIILKVLASLKFMKLWVLIWSVMVILHTHNFLASFTLEIISTNALPHVWIFFFWFQVNLVTQFEFQQKCTYLNFLEIQGIFEKSLHLSERWNICPVSLSLHFWSQPVLIFLGSNHSCSVRLYISLKGDPVASFPYVTFLTFLAAAIESTESFENT